MNKRIVNHATIFNFIWMIIPLLVVVFGLPIRENVFFLMLIYNIAFIIGYNLKRGPINNVFRIDEGNYLRFKKLNKYTIGINLIGVLFLLFFLNIRISDFSSLTAFALKASSISSLRYSNGLELPFINRIINSIIYFVIAYNGFYFASNRNKTHFINLILLAIQTIILNTKATLVFALAFWVGGFLSGIRFFNISIKLKSLFKYSLYLGCIFIFFVSVNFIRHDMEYTYFEEIKKIGFGYTISPFSAYNLWYDTKKHSELQYGLNTFEGIFRMLLPIKHKHGNMMYFNGINTNVYTVFKHLNSDFGTIGSIIFMFIIGVLGNLLGKKNNSKNMKSVAFSIILYSFLLTTFFSSIFRYNINIVSMILIYIYAIFYNRKSSCLKKC